MKQSRTPIRIRRGSRKIGFLGRGMSLTLGEKSDLLHLMEMKLGLETILTVKLTLKRYRVDADTVPSCFGSFFSGEPKVVVYPKSADDVANILEICADEQTPLVIRGAGTAGLGGAYSRGGGVVLDLSQMDKIEGIERSGDEVIVMAGCRWGKLLGFLNSEGYEPYEFPLSGDLSTVGGWISTGGLGYGSVGGGGFRNRIVSMQVAIPSGLVIDASKDGLRYSIRSFTGTEGQMGVVTLLRFKIRRITQDKHTVFCLSGKLSSLIKVASQVLDSSNVQGAMTILSSGVCKMISIDAVEDITLLIDLGDQTDSTFESLIDGFVREIDSSVRMIKLDLSPMQMMIGGSLLAQGVELIGEVIINLKPAAAFINSVVERLSGKAEVLYFIHILSSDRCLVFFFRIAKPSLRGTLVRNPRETFRIVSQAISSGGRAYGVGVWNTFFSKITLGSDYRALKQVKRETDRLGLLNSGRFFGLRSGWGIPIPGFLLKAALKFG
ncbi:MAG: FAD-binding oxidoreductase [bacterium]